MSSIDIVNKRGGGNVLISKSKCGYPLTTAKDKTLWCDTGSFVDGWWGKTDPLLGLTSLQIRCSKPTIKFALRYSESDQTNWWKDYYRNGDVSYYGNPDDS